jgi:cold-inducible RNA-binding protein
MRLYVGNISKDIDKAQLTELFTPYGTPESVEIAVRGDGGPSRGFGFVEMKDATEAAAAMTGLDGKEVNGQALKVNEARPKGSSAPKPLIPIH